MTPFLDTAFPEFPKQSVTKKEIEEAGQRFVSKYKKFSRQKLLQYLKQHDLETGLNTLFVLSEEQ